MAMVLIRGALHGELAMEVAVESVMALIVFAIVGAIAGAIVDYLVRDDLERQYRQRVAWYCEQHELREAEKKK